LANQVTTPGKGKKRRFFYGYVIVAAGFLILTIGYGAQYSFGVFFKPVLTEFGWARAETSGAYSLFMFMQGLFSILAGRLSDRFGPRIVISICGVCLGLGYLLMSQIHAIWQLYLFYGLLAGMGMGSWVPILSTVARWFIRMRGLMTGIVVAGVGVGLIAMPPLANHLISTQGWRNSYIILGFMALGIVLIASQFLKRDPAQVGQSPDGSEQLSVENLRLSTEGHSFHDAFRTGQFWMLLVIYFSFLFCIQTIMVHVVPHATDIGIQALIAATILSAIGGVSIAGKVGVGGVCDRLGSRRSLIIVFVLMAISMLWLKLALAPWAFYLFAAIFGVAYGGSVSLQSPSVADLFGLKEHGAILGVVVFGGTIGGAVGPLITGLIFDNTGSYQPGFLICAGLSVLGLVLALLLKPVQSRPKAQAGR